MTWQWLANVQPHNIQLIHCRLELETCGIIGLVYANPEKHVYQGIFDALTLLQHRGQNALGIVTVNKNKLNLRKDTWTLADVFQQSHDSSLLGNMGCGNVRYPTSGESGCSAEAQPLHTKRHLELR